MVGTGGPAIDHRFGPLAGPKKVKDREFDDGGQVRLNPLWYRLEDFKPTLLERTGAVWHFTVDEDGHILLGSDALLTIAEEDELQELLTPMREKDPALTMDQLKGYLDNQGHPTVAAGFHDTGATRLRPARISGELSYQAGRWEVSDKSGRYMSNKVRPGLDANAAQSWLSNVAQEMSQQFGVHVEAVLFKNAAAPHPAPPVDDNPDTTAAPHPHTQPTEAAAHELLGANAADPPTGPGRQRFEEGPGPSAAHAPLAGSSTPLDDWNAFEKADPGRASRVLRDAAVKLAGPDPDDAAGQEDWVKRTFGQLPDAERRRNTPDLAQILVNRATTGESYPGGKGGARGRRGNPYLEEMLRNLEQLAARRRVHARPSGLA